MGVIIKPPGGAVGALSIDRKALGRVSGTGTGGGWHHRHSARRKGTGAEGPRIREDASGEGWGL